MKKQRWKSSALWNSDACTGTQDCCLCSCCPCGCPPKYRRRRAFPLLPALQSPACLPLAESSPCSSGSSNDFILNTLYSSSFVWKSWGGFHFPAQILTYISSSSSYSITSCAALVFTGLDRILFLFPGWKARIKRAGISYCLVHLCITRTDNKTPS